MKLNLLSLLWLIGLTIFLFGVYGPRRREFKQTRKNELRSSPLDMLLHFSTFPYISVAELDSANFR